MKWLYYGVLLASMGMFSIAQAQIINEHLSQDHKSFQVHLNKSDILVINYDLERKPIFRQHEWQYYIIFCHALGKAQVEYTNDSLHLIKKIPILMSKEEYGQEDIATNIDKTGELKITNLSEFYSGTEVICGLYNKFGE